MSKFGDLIIEQLIYTGLKIKVKILFTSVILLISFIGNGYNTAKTDSLKQELIKTHTASHKIELLFNLSKNFLTIDPDSVIFFAERASALSKTSGYTEQLAGIYGVLGDAYVMQDSLLLAEKYYDTCLVLLEKENDNFGIAGVLTVLGNINLVLDNTSEALQYYLRALKISRENRIFGRLPYLYLNIGTIQSNAGNNIEAQDYYAQALKGFEAENDSINSARVLSSLGATYSRLQNFELANDYYKRALSIFKNLNSEADIASTYYNLADIEKLKGSYDKAIEYLKISQQNIENIDYTFAGPRLNISSQVEIELGENFLLTGDLLEAKKHLLKGYNIASKNGFLYDTENASKNLANLYELQGLFDSALYYHKIYKEKSESLINVANIKKLATIEAQNKYEQLEIEKEINRKEKEEEQQRKNIFYIVAIVFLLLLAMLLTLFLKLGRNREKRIALEQLNLKKELDTRNKELTTHVMYQLKKNELILNIIQQLSKTVSNFKPENKKVIQDIIRQLEVDSGDEVWKEFEVRFQQVHTGFYKALTKQFPDLSSNELRLCAFLRLNMNTKDISAITYQSVNSIDVARSRLRQKIGLSKEESLTAFLSKF